MCAHPVAYEGGVWCVHTLLPTREVCGVCTPCCLRGRCVVCAHPVAYEGGGIILT